MRSKKKPKKTIKKKVPKEELKVYDTKIDPKNRRKLIIHQIYGVFRDGKPLSDFPLFVDSKKAWTALAKKAGYRYKLWNDSMCTKLINKYSEFKKMYNSVKEPVMRADIMRFLILYDEGGMYVDMDVFPLKKKYEYDRLAFCEYYYTPKKPHTNTDMEVIYAPKGSEVMYDYLKFVETQIKEKGKSLPKSWKVRYIFYTTGPRALMKFLKMHKVEYDEIKSNLGKSDDLRQFKGVDYDVISYFSMSYNPHGDKNVGYDKKKKKK
jgi:mannosyltransferase OCH1-like enzyme